MDTKQKHKTHSQGEIDSIDTQQPYQVPKVSYKPKKKKRRKNQSGKHKNRNKPTPYKKRKMVSTHAKTQEPKYPYVNKLSKLIFYMSPTITAKI